MTEYSKLNLNKIVILGSKFWKELGGKIPFWIKEDALKGIMQNNTSGHAYKSLQYVKYKVNQMRKFGRGKKKTGQGERLKDYKAVPIQSSSANPVDMTLTGQTIDGLAVIGSNDIGVTLSYKQKDAGKVIGNKARGYNIVGLNNKNIEKVKSDITSEYKKRLIKLPKVIEIQVG